MTSRIHKLRGVRRERYRVAMNLIPCGAWTDRHLCVCDETLSRIIAIADEEQEELKVQLAFHINRENQLQRQLHAARQENIKYKRMGW